MSELMIRESSELIHGDGRTVVVQLAKWNEPRTVSDDGRTTYREAFESFELADRISVVDRHHGEIIGHADPESYRSDPEPTIDLHIAETARGDDVLALIRSGTIDGVSVEFQPSPTDQIRDGVVRRAGALLKGIAFAFRPSHTAPILATREATEQETPNMADEATTDPAGLTREDLDSFGDELKREVIEQMGTAPALVGRADPYADLRKFRSLGEFALAHYDDPEADTRILTRALEDQITSESPGVIPPAWVNDVKGIVDNGRPTITAFGTTALPPAGMELNWPFYDGDVTALVAEQLTEKAEINSVKVPIQKGTVPLASYAGGSDISMQLVRRSSPSYLDAYSRIMSIGYSAATDVAAITAAVADGTTGVIPWDPASGTAEDLMAALFGGSTQVEAATGSPAAFAIVDTVTYVAIGTLGVSQALVVPPEYGTQNVRGTASAGSLQINISGIPIIHDQYAPAGTFIISNSIAADWHEDGPMTLQADNVAQLGVDWAIWGMGAFTTYAPNGVVVVPTAGP